jgi:hypothetical protein
MAYDQLDHIPDPWAIGAQISFMVACGLAVKINGRAAKYEDFIHLSRRPVTIPSGEEGRDRLMAIITGANRPKPGEEIRVPDAPPLGSY